MCLRWPATVTTASPPTPWARCMTASAIRSASCRSSRRSPPNYCPQYRTCCLGSRRRFPVSGNSSGGLLPGGGGAPPGGCRDFPDFPGCRAWPAWSAGLSGLPGLPALPSFRAWEFSRRCLGSFRRDGCTRPSPYTGLASAPPLHALRVVAGPARTGANFRGHDAPGTQPGQATLVATATAPFPGVVFAAA